MNPPKYPADGQVVSPRTLIEFHGVRIVRPWLPRAHPTFFLIYAATLVYHLWCGIQLLTPGGDGVPALLYVNSVQSPIVWGVTSLVIGAGMWVALHFTTFTPARALLAAGIVWCGARMALVCAAWLQGIPTALSIPNLALITFLHIAQTLEPPANPLSAQTRAARKATR